MPVWTQVFSYLFIGFAICLVCYEIPVCIEDTKEIVKELLNND